jgi:hypothetical protein
VNLGPSDHGAERALGRWAAERAALAAEGDRPARPGDLFAPPATARWPVEWLAVGPAPGAPGRLLAVPADAHPLAGSGDVAIPEAAPGGPLTVRCRFAVEIAAADLDPASRSGVVGGETLAEVARVRSDLDAGRLVASEEQEEIESSPEYRRWVAEAIAPACAALVTAGAPVAPLAPIRSRAPGARRGRSGRRIDWYRALPLAASVLLAVSLALGGGVVVQTRRLDRAEAERAAGERRLHAEVEALSEAGRRQAETLRLEIERLTAENLAAQAAAERPQPPPAPAPSPLVNLPFAWLRPEGDPTRGEPQAIEVSPAAGLLALILPIDDPGDHRRFRLEILADATGRRVWTTDALTLTGLAETSLALPADLLPPGDYTLRLSGLGERDPAPLATYRLRVTGGAAER